MTEVQTLSAMHAVNLPKKHTILSLIN